MPAMTSTKTLPHQTIDALRARRVLIVLSNPTISPVSGVPVGFWWSELSEVYWELRKHAYGVEFASPLGGEVKADGWSDPDNAAGFADDDILSRGFKNSPKLMAQLASTRKLSDVDPATYDAIYLIGGQGPVITFFNDEDLHRFVAKFYETGKAVAIVCHATCTLLRIKLSNGELLAAGKSWTGSAKLEETLREDFVGKRLYPFYIQEEAGKIAGTNYVAVSPFKEHVIRDGNLITGQQQYSALGVARELVRALGV